MPPYDLGRANFWTSTPGGVALRPLLQPLALQRCHTG